MSMSSNTPRPGELRFGRVRYREMERIVRRAPLGLRCIDLAHNVPVGAGLVVQARHVSGSGGVFTAYRSPVSGIFGYNTLPGLADYEWDRSPASAYASPSDPLAPQNYLITIEDAAGRYLPQAIRLTLPQERVIPVLLFSSPARPVSSAFGVIRATLWDAVNQRPAAWALLTATIDSTDYQAVADARGEVALWVLYPSIQHAPNADTTPMTDLAWPVTISVQYQPSAQEPLPVLPPTAPPEHKSILAQTQGTLEGLPTLSRNLIYRKEVILKTASDTRSRQHVEPAP